MSNNRFKVLAVNDDASECECCGKSDLKRVVWIEDTETGSIQHFGVVCATNPAKAFGLDGEIKAAIKAHTKEQKKKANEADMLRRAARMNAFYDLKISLYAKKGGTYRVHTFSNGSTGNIPENEKLMAACHTAAFLHMEVAA